MKLIIIDDEIRARRVLTAILKNSCPNITIILEADNLIDGVNLIKSHQPQIVLLDIEMPKHSGLEILEFFNDETINFQIIFTTAYNKYAIEAFKLSAIDYLLKPIDENELQQAINKAKTAIDKLSIPHKIENLKKAFHQLALNKIAIDVPKGIKFVSHNDIIYFEADGTYTKVYLINGESELICKTLKHFSDQLNNNPLFYKPHRSYLINLKFMKEVIKKGGHHIILTNGNLIPIAREKKDDFLQMISTTFS